MGAALVIDVWIKRKDCTGLALGVNKVRQLEFDFGAAQACGAETVLITGAVQPNLVRIAAAGAHQVRDGGAHPARGAGGRRQRGPTAHPATCCSTRVLGAALHAFPEAGTRRQRTRRWNRARGGGL